ncbi:MAG: polysaccharide deacetylase family protein [Bacteroidia bacterium]|nr:polysaccharide deacetylase family protein [Bacteroidia bacterium]
MDKLIIYSEKESPRLTYIADLVFHKLLGFHVDVTSNKDTYNAVSRVKINYSDNLQLDGFHMAPDGLLFEKNLVEKQVRQGTPYHGLPTLLVNPSESFDILGSSFFLVSRYEEYLDYVPDDHNRFPATASCLVQYDLLKRPLINEWCLALYTELKRAYPEISTQQPDFDYCSTLDIDQAWKYRNKGIVRTMGGIVRDMLKSDWQEVRDRIRVLIGTKHDPFYNFDWQDQVHANHGTRVQYFVQIGKSGEFDKNTKFGNPEFQQLIKRLDDTHAADIHPSYQSNKDFPIVQREVHALANLLARDVHVSRQHYLIMSMPKTYQNLIDLGITSDHTLGYSTHTGFRAGIAVPFQFFDLERNRSTQLKLVPFCMMDITPLHYDGLSAEQAKTAIRKLMDDVKRVNGTFVSLWHNESLSESGRWVGWRTVYEDMIAYAQEIG